MTTESFSPSLVTDHLMLLVGINPLPNYVAAKLLSNEKTCLHLLVTDEILTSGIHKRLIKLLGKDPSNESQYLLVKSSDPHDIYTRVKKRVKSYPGSWGLNYTGGKKIMAAHAYRAMEHVLKKKHQKGIYSYLDADTLELIIDDGDKCERKYVHFEVAVSIQEILELHDRRVNHFTQTPFHPEVGQMLVSYCQNADNRKKWLNWARDNLKRADHRDLNETLARQVTIPIFFPAIISNRSLADLCNEWHNEKSPAELAKWLHGAWLDDYVLFEAQKAAVNSGAHQVVSSLRPQGMIEFEVDVVVMQGYRLYAISATTADEKGLAKLKMFEALFRARQMGGDEAKVALVTFSERPSILEKQLAEKLYLLSESNRKDWKSPVRVYGIHDLPDLACHLKIWFKEV